MVEKITLKNRDNRLSCVNSGAFSVSFRRKGEGLNLEFKITIEPGVPVDSRPLMADIYLPNRNVSNIHVIILLYNIQTYYVQVHFNQNIMQIKYSNR